MKQDKAEAVLRDYRSGKATNAGELARLHGVSRSAVYRLLSKQQGDGAQAQQEAAQPPAQPQKARLEDRRPMREAVENGGDDEGEALTLADKVDRFANSLGLPDDSGKISHEEPKDDADREAKEKQLDLVMDGILGQQDAFRLPEGIAKALEEPKPKRQPVATPRSPIDHEPEAQMMPVPHLELATRADLTQKIIFNIQHFGPQLEIITGPDKEKFIASLALLGTRQLGETLVNLERTRSVGNIAAGFKQVFYVAGQTTEFLSATVGMRTEGFTQQLRQQDEEIGMIMKELAIQQWERLKAFDSPSTRLGMLFCMTLVQTDARNRLNDQMRVPEHVQQQHADL